MTEHERSPAAGFDVYNPACPARQVLDHLTSRWGVLTFAALRERGYRFGELRRLLNGVTEKVLSQTLQTLEHDGFVLREVYPDAALRVEYSLTEHGREAAELLAGLVSWIELTTPRVLREHQLRAERDRCG